MNLGYYIYVVYVPSRFITDLERWYFEDEA